MPEGAAAKYGSTTLTEHVGESQILHRRTYAACEACAYQPTVELTSRSVETGELGRVNRICGRCGQTTYDVQPEPLDEHWHHETECHHPDPHTCAIQWIVAHQARKKGAPAR